MHHKYVFNYTIVISKQSSIAEVEWKC